MIEIGAVKYSSVYHAMRHCSYFCYGFLLGSVRQAGNINRVLKNPFYCGRIEYRKQYVPDYLTQKKINNHGEIEKVYVQGTHEILVSPEDFDEVQRITASRSIKKDGEKSYGKPEAKCVWVKKTRCTCNHAMNRRTTYVAKNGEKSFMYQCYHQLHTGTPAARLKKGLPIDGVCDNTTFTEWKLKGKIAVLVDLCTDCDISKEVFREKKQKLESQIEKLEQLNMEYRQKILDDEKETVVAQRMESLTAFIKMKAFDEKAKIPETIIDHYVDKITYDKGTFTWILNPRLGNKVSSIKVDGSSLKKTSVIESATCHADSCTGSIKQSVGYRSSVIVNSVK